MCFNHFAFKRAVGALDFAFKHGSHHVTFRVHPYHVSKTVLKGLLNKW